MLNRDKLVAHRGEMLAHPENTLAALQAAVDAGARYVEFDIQVSSDHVPMVFHDVDLQRVTHARGQITHMTAKQLVNIRVNHPTKTSNLESRVSFIPRLADAIDMLNQTPHITAFVEIKRQSLDTFGVDFTVDRVIEVLLEARFPWVIISFRDDALDYLRRTLNCRIGWVLSSHCKDTRQRAQSLAPDYLFCNVTRLQGKTDDYWRGPWQWAIYDIMDIEQAELLLQQGANLIETGDFTRMAVDIATSR